VLKDSTIVLKFGGSSVADPDCIRRISQIAIKEAQAHNVVMVVSAMGKTTNGLISLAEEIKNEPRGRELDMLLASGEIVSSALTAMCLQSLGHPALSMTGWQAGFITERAHNKARIAEIKTDRILKHLSKGQIVVVAGFQGVTEDGEITTLGRGGSDTSAVALAAALNADRCDIYTDVDGVYSTDPRIVPKAQKMDYISYEEMIELASLGAKVLHPRSVELAKKYNIDLWVRSSFDPENKGTQVISLKRIRAMELTRAVTGIALDTKQAKVGILGVPDRPGIASKIFTTLAEKNVSIDMIVQSVPREEHNEIAFTVPKDSLAEARDICEGLLPEIRGKEVVIRDDIAKVSIVGAGMLNRPGIAAQMFRVLAENDINIDMISTSEIKVSCIIGIENAEKAVRVVHETFELEKSEEPVIV
jgi:aspartate kinase